MTKEQFENFFHDLFPFCAESFSILKLQIKLAEYDLDVAAEKVALLKSVLLAFQTKYDKLKHIDYPKTKKEEE